MSNLSLFRNSDFDRFRKDMDRVFNGFWSNNAYAPGYTSSDSAAWSPVCELVETDKTYIIKAELPGCQEKDIDVQVASNQLSIKGDKKADYDESKGAYHFTERSFGVFFRSFTLPATVDTTKIRARFAQGVLEIEMPKTSVATLTKVKVEAK